MPPKARTARPAPTRGGLTDRLLAGIEASGLSLHELAARSGVDKAGLSRFLRGERGLSLDSADRLAHTLRLRLVEAARPAARKAARVAAPPGAAPE